MRGVILAVACLLVANVALATKVGTKRIDCSRCGERYVIDAILSWSFAMSDGAPPPAPEGCCPHCLFSWRREQPLLSTEARSRVDAVLAEWPARIPADLRDLLLEKLGDGAEEMLSNYLAAICTRAIAGELPEPLPPFSFHEATRDEKKVHAFRELLPQMLSELRRGKLRTLPADFGDREMSALFTSADLVRAGDADAAEFSVRWILSVGETRAEKCDYAISQALKSLVRLPDTKWASLDFSSARAPLLGETLRYARDGGAVSKLMRKQLALPRWTWLSNIVANVCTARRDRSVHDLFAQQRLSLADLRNARTVADYFAATGTSDDLALLRGVAERFSGNAERQRDPYEFSRKDIEKAMRIIRLRHALGSSS